MAGRRLALSLARSGAVRRSNPTQELAPSVSSARKASCALPSCPLPSHHVLLSPAHQRQRPWGGWCCLRLSNAWFVGSWAGACRRA